MHASTSWQKQRLRTDRITRHQWGTVWPCMRFSFRVKGKCLPQVGFEALLAHQRLWLLLPKKKRPSYHKEVNRQACIGVGCIACSTQSTACSCSALHDEKKKLMIIIIITIITTIVIIIVIVIIDVGRFRSHVGSNCFGSKYTFLLFACLSAGRRNASLKHCHPFVLVHCIGIVVGSVGVWPGHPLKAMLVNGKVTRAHWNMLAALVQSPPPPFIRLKGAGATSV